MEANALSGNDTITLPAGTYTLSRTGIDEDSAVTGDLDITTNITINGAGAATTIINANSIDRVFQVPNVSGANATITGVTIKNGNTSSSTQEWGGAIMASQPLTLTDVIVEDNVGGGNGGGVASVAPTFITRCTIRNNYLEGASLHIGTGGGGGVFIGSDGDLVDGFLDMENSTVSGNTIHDSYVGGGICTDGPANIVRSTISGNFAPRGTGIYFNDKMNAVDNLLDQTTITDNTFDICSAYASGFFLKAGYITVTHTIIADNSYDCTGNDTPADLYIEGGTFDSDGYNLIGYKKSGSIYDQQATDLVGVSSPIDPQLATLANNGGPTWTHALLAGSPAIDGGQELATGTDQRAAARNVDGDGDSTGAWDIGAYEYGGFGILAFASSALSVNEADGTVTVTVSRSGGSVGAVSVNYATSNGSATAGSDYTAASGTLSWSNGVSGNKTFTVTITDDAINEGNETINLTLSSPTGGADLGTAQASITIAGTYAVTFDKQSGSGGSNSVTATYGSAMPSATAPTRVGYTFGGYYTQTGGAGTQYYTAAMASAQSWNVAAATTLYAKWTVNQYTITFDSAGGSAVADITQAYGSAVNAPAAPTRDGYTLAGWNPAVPATMPLDGASLTAQWTANSYTVTFDAQGGTAPDPASKAVTYASSYGQLATTTRTGYAFGGWYTAVDGGAKISSENTVATASDHTLYARWALTTYTLTYLAGANGSINGESPQTVAHGSSGAAVEAVPATGYHFTQWSDSSTANPRTDANVTADLSVTAQFAVDAAALPDPGDIDNNGAIDLTDAILAARILSLQAVPQEIFKTADVNGDDRIGMEEMGFILRQVAGL